MKSSGINTGKVTASLSGLYSVNRTLSESNLPAGLTTQEAIIEVAQETIPVPADKLYLSWQTITAGAGEQGFFVLGIPREIVDGEMQALRAVGIKPRILELKAIALARLANETQQAIILNMGLSSFDIVIVANGTPAVMRTIPWQQGELTVEDKAEHSAVNLELSAGYYNLNYPDSPLAPTTPLFITGEMSGDPILMEKLQARLEYQVEPLSPPLKCPEELPVSEYAVNIGLALRERALSRNPRRGGYLPLNLNLLPIIYRPWRPSSRQLVYFGVLILLIALLFPLFQATGETMDITASLHKRVSALNNDMHLRRIELKKREPLQGAINEYTNITNMGGNFTEDLRLINSEAGRLSVEVQSINHTGEEINVTCEANSYTAFRALCNALDESERFSLISRPPEQYGYISGGTITLEPLTGK